MALFGYKCDCDKNDDKIYNLRLEIDLMKKQHSENLYLLERKLEERVDYHIKQFLVNFERELNSRKEK